MKKLQIILLLILVLSTHINAQNLSFDAKYIKVGVISNEWPRQMSENPNFRNLGELFISFNGDEKLDAKQLTEDLNRQRVGKLVLDKLFQRDNQGLHIDSLYNEALKNTTIEEIEIALQDISAETKDILKKDISRQLLKNNYIVVFQTVKKKRGDKVKTKKYWQVFHVDIDTRIIEQVFLNWETPQDYDQIEVPVSFVAEGKVPREIKGENELVFDIAKKVPAFAIRGSAYSRVPFLARTNSRQGVKNKDRFYIYRFKEKKAGKIYSKKICTARATDIDNESTRLFTISGRYASIKKGDIAVQRDRHKSSLSVTGQYSSGNDSRYGGRLQYEHLLHFSKHGIAQYFLTSVDYNAYEKEPEGIWWDNYGGIQPRLNNAALTLGYGTGINLLGRMELMPYILAGYQYSFLLGASENPTYWDHSLEKWDDLTKTSGHAIVGYAGIKLSANLWYPVQLTAGADYNLTTSSTSAFKPVLSRHKKNRLNVYAGLRFHF